MRRSAVAALAFVVAGALWLSASSTLALGVRHQVPDLARPALVVVLEVASVIGTALWVTAPRGSRVKPGVVVVLASLVAAVGGWQAYGWLGLVGPIAVVLVTDMVAERWSGLAQPANPDPVVADAATGAPVGAGREGSLAPTESPTPDPATVPAVAGAPAGADQGGSTAPAASPIDEDDVEADQVARLREIARDKGRMPGRDAVKAEFGVGSAKANRLRDKAARPALALAAEVS